MPHIPRMSDKKVHQQGNNDEQQRKPLSSTRNVGKGETYKQSQAYATLPSQEKGTLGSTTLAM